MGIKQLSKLIKEKAPKAIKIRKIQFYSSYSIAMDATMCIYQFLIAVRSDGNSLGFEGNTTAHLIGMFYRTIRLIENGILPIYVFDGKAPAEKIQELKKRLNRREEATKLLQLAIEEGNKENIEKYDKRKTKIESWHVEECKKLLKLMGVPFVTAVSEAEAYCAFLNKKGCVKAVGTEDMDALCFGADVLLRNLNSAQSKNMDIEEYNLKVILKEMEITMESFIDLCILLGCDFSDTIKGIGPKKAYELIKKYGSIERILADVKVSDNGKGSDKNGKESDKNGKESDKNGKESDKNGKESDKNGKESDKESDGDNGKSDGDNGKSDNVEKNSNPFEYKKAREIFRTLSELGEEQIFKMDNKDVDREGVIKFLCEEKGFDEKRVSNGLERIMKSKSKSNQTRLESFFGGV